MTLATCKECGKEISTDADACPHCGSKPGLQSGWLAAILVFLGTVGVLRLFQPAEAPKAPPPFDPEATVRGMCMQQIKLVLHDPGSAEFEHSRTTQITRSGDVWTVLRPVRAKNAFNATRRSVFACVYRQTGESFSTVSVTELRP